MSTVGVTERVSAGIRLAIAAVQIFIADWSIAAAATAEDKSLKR
jgi:hypothetical protein